MTDSTPLDDVEFLARSPHRVAVLRALAAASMTRPDLHEETGIPQPTLGRILGDFEDRHWVERTDREYALTPWGDLLAEEFENLLDTVETIQHLGDVIHRLPTEEMDFDIREFGDATVTTPESGDIFRHVRRVEELLYRSDRVRNLSPTIAPGTPEDFQNRWEEFLDGDQQVEGIISTNTLEGMVEGDMTGYLGEALELDRMEMYLYDGDVPLLLGVADGTAILAPTDEHDIPVAVVETENEAVRSWIESQLDEYREQSAELTVGDLTP